MVKIQKNILEGWKFKILGEVAKVITGSTPITSHSKYYGGDIMFVSPADFNTKRIIRTKKTLSIDGFNQCRKIPKNSVLFVCIGSTIGKIGIAGDNLATNQQINAVIGKNVSSDFLYYSLMHKAKKIKLMAGIQAVPIVSKSLFESVDIFFPSEKEQNRIVAVLETWDKAIEKLAEKIELKKKIKKGLMQRLLSGKVRLPGFSDKWQTVELIDLLEYEQPTEYLVNNNGYNDKFETPVLTANKSFILGYTDEKNGIYSEYPAIIFDDFTTDSKYVDFAFKVKSSAIKILKIKDEKADLRFVFEKMRMLNFITGGHKRHYISEYQYQMIDVPALEEQSAISKIIKTADDEIKALDNKMKLIKLQKKYLLNNLITGTIRVSEKMSEPLICTD